MAKNVVDGRQVAHLWANKSQDQARNSGETIYFVGPVIFSYGSHFIMAAHLENGRILVNDATYGNTTSKHQSWMRNALDYAQWQNAIHVPKLDDNHWRNLQRIHGQDKKEKHVLPDLAKLMADEITFKIKAMAGARMSGKLLAAFDDCVHLEKHAKDLIVYSANGRKAAKWPIADMPASLPTDKEERAAWIKGMVRDDLLKSATMHCDQVEKEIRAIESTIDLARNEPMHWDINNVAGKLHHARATVNYAQRDFDAAGKKQIQVRKLRASLDALAPVVQKIYSDFKAAHALREMRGLARQGFKALREVKNRRVTIRSPLTHIHSKMNSAKESLSDGQFAPWAALHARIGRMDDWLSDVASLDAAKSAIETSAQWGEHRNDALSSLRTVARHLANADRHVKFREIHAAEIQTLRADTLQKIEEQKAIIAAKHATAIDDWKAGRINHLPHDAGTFGRIKGDVVQTSRGASVPIEHACRLARIARRVIAHGGAKWADGTGPQVGGFRVNSIGADGAAVIGCHEFDADESVRLLALLDACPQCSSVSESV